ncbi:60 kDa lysophospholipase-like [Colossoma macropomum]|uniref:60 kDa lysophospholipase-like n=1 Tax=Colossoma macropomum TaxID=42526 RepID=UPI001864A56C|nr:60 kDa lysophospholipase-like [Colossoma macropomum]
MAVERKVYVLYTGGTFGMKKDDTGRLAPQGLDGIKDFLIAHTILYERNPGESEEEVRKRIITPDGLITLYHQLADDDPRTKDKQYKILYKLDTLPKPIDSSSLVPDDWGTMAERIQLNMEKFDGFVIIHGTDTMAFTASALSFILRDLHKPVIVTGAQMPIFHPRTDGLDNFVGSMLMAGYFSDRKVLHKVMLYCLNKLYQGNRVVKVDCDSFGVFDSPDVYPLASLESTIKLITSVIEHKKVEPVVSCSVKRTFTLKKKPEVRILRFFPGVTESYVQGVLDGADGVVLETFGSGNVPEVDWLKNLLTEADKRGVLMLNCSQVYRGTVLPIYAASKILTDAHVIPGYDITPEAAMTKLIWVLKSDLDHLRRQQILEHSVCGESRAPAMWLKTEPGL